MSTHASSIAILCLDDVHVILSVACKGMALQFLSENKTKIFFLKVLKDILCLILQSTCLKGHLYITNHCL